MPPRARVATAHDQKLAEIRQKRKEAQAQLAALRAEQKKDAKCMPLVLMQLLC
jgi:hypothetical protein